MPNKKSDLPWVICPLDRLNLATDAFNQVRTKNLPVFPQTKNLEAMVSMESWVY